ncbi:MAG: DUF922 domain-containing Zn-dependent protease [Cyanobacteria bacterium CRU_2_1]|nr:DUF922 domain-containing Zn-dependent protease [Cyanobacteria bacterium CRU_2_1]
MPSLKEDLVLSFIISLLFFILIISPTPAPPNQNSPEFNDETESLIPIVRIHYDYYPIDGTTAAELRSQMLQDGSMSELEERRYDAYTKWRVQWSYNHAMTEQGCMTASLEGQVDITFTLPQWDTPPNTSSSLIEAWNQYLAALQVHENGHMVNGLEAGIDVLYTLSRSPAYSSCQELEASVDTTTEQIIHYYNQQDINYDRHTQHGLTQGAVFPPAHPSALREPRPQD